MSDKIKHEKVDYSSDMQELFISIMLSDPELYVRCQNILKASYFTPHLKPVVSLILKHAEEYKGLPTPEIIKAQTDVDIKLLSEIQPSTKDWFMATIESFCRHSALFAAINKSADLIAEGYYGDVEGLIKDAVLVSLKRDLGTNYFEDPKGRLERLLSQNGSISTGWKSVDDIIFNLGKGELAIFTAVTGGGKSVALQNLAINWILQNYKVIYFTFELSEELVSKRIDSMITGIPNINIFKNIDKVEYIVKNTGKKAGNLQIVYMRPGTNTNDIRAYLKEFEIQNNTKPDMIVIDYLDLMYPNSKRVDVSNFFAKDKLVSEELRGLGMEMGMIVASASQLNRCLTLDTWVYEQNRGRIRISEVELGNRLLSRNRKYNEVKKIFPVEKQNVYKITTSDGREIKCSKLHVFPTESSFKNIALGLTVGDKLLAITKIDGEQLNDTITSIEEIGEVDTIDISLNGDNLFFANDILTHNSGYDEMSPSSSNISGGISKAFTADLVVNIGNTPASRERGEITFMFMKTRNSGGVGKYLSLKFDIDTLRISDLDGYESGNRPNRPTMQQVRTKAEVLALIDENKPTNDVPVFDNTEIGKSAPKLTNSSEKKLSPVLQRLIDKTKNT